jgi:hypothetical protein
MLRRIPYTPLVCLVLLVSLFFLSPSWAVAPDESLDVLLKPNNSNLATSPPLQQGRAKRPNFGLPAPWTGNPYVPAPAGISKVKAPPPIMYPAIAPMMGCFLPSPRVGQWQIEPRPSLPLCVVRFNGLQIGGNGMDTVAAVTRIGPILPVTSGYLLTRLFQRSTPNISSVATGQYSTPDWARK